MSRRTGALAAGLLTLAVLVVLIWSRMGGALTDEQVLLQQIDAAAEAAEQRDLKRLRGWLADDYHDEAGRGRAEINQLLSLHFLRGGRLAVYVLSKEVQLERGPAPRTADATVRAVLTRGRRLKRLQDVVPDAARSLVFTLSFRKGADEGWLLTSASWREAGDLRQILGR